MYINFKTVKEIIVLAKPLKQFIFGGTIWQKCRPITFKFTKQLFTQVPHRHFSKILFYFWEHLFKSSIDNSLSCTALIDIFWFMADIAVTIILQVFSQYSSNNGWFHIAITAMHQLSIALIKQTYKHCTYEAKYSAYSQEVKTRQ